MRKMMNGSAAAYLGLDAEPTLSSAGETEIASAPVWVRTTSPHHLDPSLNELAACASEPTAFAEPWFMAASLRHLELPDTLRLLEVWSGPEEQPLMLGLLPVMISGRYGRLPMAHVENWRHFHCFLGTPLVRAGREKDFWAAILRFLDGQKWARGFLHLTVLLGDGPVHQGLAAAARDLGRPCDVVHRSERAMLAAELSPQLYYETNVRKKKRKELKRLSVRLAELGKVETRTLSRAEELGPWCDAFLALEKSGWKGKSGSALACDPRTEAFFRDVVEDAFAAGRLDMLRLDLDGQPVAMLVNFLTAPGSFSFKTAFDEDFARFSPGVLIQLENLRILDRPDIRWMDSCAIENHPMINGLWAERRQLVNVSVPLSGAARTILFRFYRLAENLWAILKRARTPARHQAVDDHE